MTNDRRQREVALLAAIAALLLLVGFLSPHFFAAANLRALLVNMCPPLLVAAGMTLVIIARHIDVSVGAQFCICGIIAGLFSEAHLPLVVAAGGAILAGAIMGAINGLLVTRLGLPSIVVTLATLVIGRESLRWLRQGAFVRDLPPGFQWFGLSQSDGQWIVVVVSLLLFALIAGSARHLAFGRAIFAAGSDPEAAHLVGLQPQRIVLSVFTLLGALTGCAAVLNAVRFADVDPNAGAGLEMQVIAAAVAGGAAVSGGRGSLPGTLLAVLLLGLIGPALVFLGIQPHWEKAIQGLIILIAVAADSTRRRAAA